MNRVIAACIVLASFLLVTSASYGSEPGIVVIVKFATHPALDDFENGFIAYLKGAAVHSPRLRGLNIERYDANGSPQRAKQLAESATRSDVRLIVAIATPAAQAVVRTPSSIPLLYGAVADPKGAGIIPSARATGIQNSGPRIIERAVKAISCFFPKAKRIGTIYNPSEQNSVYVQDLIKRSCRSVGLQLVQRTVTDSTQLSSITEGLVSEVDVIYSANDNMVNAGVAAVVSVCIAKKKPFVIGDLTTLSKGPAVAVGLEYRSMGRKLGAMAEQVLLGKPLSKILPQGPPDPEVWVNESTLRALGVKVPSKPAVRIDRICR